MDITDTLAPNGDQLDAIELVAGPRTFTISDVSRGNPDQPVNIHLAEFPRVWRPSKSMRRVLAAGWGTDASQYVGRRLTLFCDPEVMFGKDKVGGTRISHMSHLDKTLRVPLLITRGKSKTFVVEPLVEQQRATPQPQPSDPSADEIAACTDLDVLGRWWRGSSPVGRTAIEARVAQLKAAAS